MAGLIEHSMTLTNPVLVTAHGMNINKADNTATLANQIGAVLIEKEHLHDNLIMKEIKEKAEDLAKESFALPDMSGLRATQFEAKAVDPLASSAKADSALGESKDVELDGLIKAYEDAADGDDKNAALETIKKHLVEKKYTEAMFDAYNAGKTDENEKIPDSLKPTAGGRRRRKSNKKPKSRRGGRRVRRKSNKRRR